MRWTTRGAREHFRVMRHIKLPLIVTGITLLVAIIIGLAVVTWIHRSPISNQQKAERAQKLGGAVAGMTCLIIAPFWLIAAAKVGKERRAARDATATDPQ